MDLFINLILPPSADPTDPQVRSRVGKRCGALGIGANAFLFTIKLLAGILSGSVAIVADALNNFSDAGSAIVTLLGFKLAEKPADEDHPYGHARFEYLSALAVAVMILLIGFELAKSSVEKIFRPTPVEFSAAAMLILAVSIAVKLLLWAVNGKLAKRIESTALAATAADSRNDCVATAAVLLCNLIVLLTDVNIDGWAGLAVAAFIARSGWQMMTDTVSPLLGEAADPQLQKTIIRCVRTSDKILGYHDLMVHDYGPGQRFASIHVEMDMREDPLLCHTIIDDIERMCLEQHQIHLVIHYDPVITDDLELNLMRNRVTQALREIDPGITFHDFRMVRGQTHTNLVFDVILPSSMKGREKEVREELNRSINEGSAVRYFTVITFDPGAFNTQQLWHEFDTDDEF